MDVLRGTPTCDFAFDGETMRATFRQGVHVKGADAREHIALMRELLHGRAVPVLIDMHEIASQDREARAVDAGEDAVAFTARCAIVISSPVARVIGSFFLGFNKPLYPTRLFTSREEAERWLASPPSTPMAHDG